MTLKVPSIVMHFTGFIQAYSDRVKIKYVNKGVV